MRHWRDRRGIVHMLDSFKFPWCDANARRDPLTPNTEEPTTCLRCVGLHLAFHAEAWACDECGAMIPNREGGSVTNKHHMEACSLHDPRRD